MDDGSGGGRGDGDGGGGRDGEEGKRGGVVEERHYLSLVGGARCADGGKK